MREKETHQVNIHCMYVCTSASSPNGNVVYFVADQKGTMKCSWNFLQKIYNYGKCIMYDNINLNEEGSKRAKDHQRGEYLNSVLPPLPVQPPGSCK